LHHVGGNGDEILAVGALLAAAADTDRHIVECDVAGVLALAAGARARARAGSCRCGSIGWCRLLRSWSLCGRCRGRWRWRDVGAG
jgi:hypothetical protein